MKPFLKIPGGKAWLLERLWDLWVPYKDTMTLVEPFCGALNIALGFMPKRAILNDANRSIINLYRHIQSGSWSAQVVGEDAVSSTLMDFGLLKSHKANPNCESAYYAVREAYNVLLGTAPNSVTAAAYYYYLNRCCFNGLHRANKLGHFNVPFGKYDTISLISDFLEYQDAFIGWHFSAKDYSEVAGDGSGFFYIDPPYDAGFANYTGNGFSWEEQIRLAVWCSKREGPVVASNAATPRILELYGDLGFCCHTLPGPRRINCRADGRKPKLEMLALSKELA